MTTTPPRWRCGCCLDHHNDYTSIVVNKFKMCTTCVKVMFERAIKHEIDYPATMMSTELHPKHFDHIISAEFVERYVQREKEYKCPTNSRAYCKHLTTGGGDDCVRKVCGKFVGPLRQEEKEIVLVVASCGDCSKLTCLKCGVALNSIEESPSHGCEKHIEEARQAEKEELERAFAGLKLGKDWQPCPNEPCNRPIQLGEACNHVICSYCKTSFCFVCGTQQSADSDHWYRGGCPRYNFPGESNAGYDGEGDVAGGGGWGGAELSLPATPVIRSRAASAGGWGDENRYAGGRRAPRRPHSPTPSMLQAEGMMQGIFD
ncbi:hypothetical protein LTR56_016007 [Elasticomyces elasticus]|nr:hypothetical protein LTR56_016007 [Elasticomyces elasticus]KAK3642453.1 hypothetical protein LTR22_016087 [Elasticomyces elasticus]KAK4926936.1 hypothetical protein LTR49_006093 [Elasticomyces elasticus]KAK5764264.1 hypothetical protein LTS12_005477 [Elasticomyces elasticus]